MNRDTRNRLRVHARYLRRQARRSLAEDMEGVIEEVDVLATIVSRLGKQFEPAHNFDMKGHLIWVHDELAPIVVPPNSLEERLLKEFYFNTQPD